MATPGTTFSALVREVWTPQLLSTVFYADKLFQLFPPEPAPGGSVITTGYEYLNTSNAAAKAYDSPLVSPGALSHIAATFTKDHYQGAARVFNQLIANGRNGGQQVPIDEAQRAIAAEAQALRAVVHGVMCADLLLQIDSSTAYSDASLSRTTYATLKSYEETTSTALTLAHLEDMIEALLDGQTYGQTLGGMRDGLLFLMSQNQLTNLSRLGANLAYNTTFGMLTTSSQDPSNIDFGLQSRVASFDGIPIVTVPGLSTTDILLVHRPSVHIYENRPLDIVEKPELADTMLWALFCGYNIVVDRPGNCGKLSAKTA